MKMLKVLDPETHQFVDLPKLHKSTLGVGEVDLIAAEHEWNKKFQQLISPKRKKPMTRREARAEMQKIARQV